MVKKTVLTVIACALLHTNTLIPTPQNPTTSHSPWNTVYNFFNPQPTYHSSTSVDNYIQRLRLDLMKTHYSGKIIPPKEIEECVIFIKNILQQCSPRELCNTDLINQYIRGAFIDYIDHKITRLIMQLRSEGYALNTAQESSIKTSEINNLIAHLNKIPHSGLNGEVLYIYFGIELRNRIMSIITNPTYQSYYSYYTPTPYH